MPSKPRPTGLRPPPPPPPASSKVVSGTLLTVSIVEAPNTTAMLTIRLDENWVFPALKPGRKVRVAIEELPDARQ